MFQLKVVGLSEAKIYIQNKWPTHVVSLIDPETRELPQFGAEHCVVRMHDIEIPMKRWTSPNEKHLETVLEFTKNLKENSKLLVHCHMGVSRSTAAAIGILIQHGLSPSSAYDLVESVRDCLYPNGLIIKMLDEKFKLSGDLNKLIGEKKLESAKNRHFINKTITEADKISQVDAMKDILGRIKF